MALTRSPRNIIGGGYSTLGETICFAGVPGALAGAAGGVALGLQALGLTAVIDHTGTFALLGGLWALIAFTVSSIIGWRSYGPQERKVAQWDAARAAREQEAAVKAAYDAQRVADEARARAQAEREAAAVLSTPPAAPTESLREQLIGPRG